VCVRRADKRSVSFSRAVAPCPHGATVLVLDVDAAVAGAKLNSRFGSDALAVERRRLAQPGPAAQAALAELEQGAEEDGAAAAWSVGGGTPTGIAHHKPLAQLLRAAPAPLVAMSFSPTATAADVRASLATLGLASVPWRSVVAPQDLLQDPAGCTPPVLLAALAAHLGRPVADLALVRDSALSLPLADALLASLQCRRQAAGDAAAYLRAKRNVDQRARSSKVVDRLVTALEARRAGSTKNHVGTSSGPAAKRSRPSSESDAVAVAEGGRTCRVVDVGAGRLSMLPVVLDAAARAGYSELVYVAIDSDGAPLAEAADELKSDAGYVHADFAFDPAFALLGVVGRTVACLRREAQTNAPAVRLFLLSGDVRALASGLRADPASANLEVDLLVASAFADLMPPAALLATLVRLAPGALAYLPITFSGRTELTPACAGATNIPSDARVFASYHDHLRAQGQHFDTEALLTFCASAGAATLAAEPSHWDIAPDDPFFAYMLDFVGSGTALPLWADGFDPAAWCQRVRERRAAFSVANVDLLLSLPAAPRTLGFPCAALEFSAPRQVNT